MSWVRASAVALGAALVLAVTCAAATAQPAMPDPRQMSGVPLPVGDVSTGTVTVRVARESVTNAVTGQEVQLAVGGQFRTATTNEAGRAEFTGLTPGSRVKASTVVDGERLESQEFDVPATGGVRLMLVAGVGAGSGGGAPGAATTPQTPAKRGNVVLGDQSRFVYEMGDESLTGFYILQIVNSEAVPVQPAEPFTIELPEGAEGATIMQGSSPQGSVAGRDLTVAGPFAPGQTQVQVAFSLPYSTGTVTISQPLPVPLTQVAVLVEKIGEMQLESPQIVQHREVRAEPDTYIVGQGPGLPAGGTLTLTISGLPHAPLWPRNVGLALALLLVVGGLVAAMRPGRSNAARDARRQKLDARREKLFADLAAVESQHAAGAVDDERYAARRRDLVRALERVYAELDEDVAA